MGAERRFSLTVEQENLVRVEWAPTIVLRHIDGALLTGEIRRVQPRRRVHLLMLLNEMTSLRQDVLAYFAKHVQLSAVALVGPSVLDQPLVDLYLEVYEPPFPVGYFATEAPARSWLRSQPTLEGPPLR
ncbi:hypothetical protein [uncultured Arthrobacter sp.]|uniref:DUF7793 family protein n=1 Tax=uncultured Arthrobacter sp. TaxID=114050 RepID=UPI00260FBCF3|nr:hypothetical protein [uncultured Arthrobacter sp.]